MDQPGMVANPARGQLNRKNGMFPVPVCVRELGLARRVWPYRPASARLCYIPRLNHQSGAYPHRASPEVIGSRNCVPMAFTAESPPAQGQ